MRINNYLYDLNFRSYVAIPANSWVDDFIDWLNPQSKCCRLYTNGPNVGHFCPANECENHFLNEKSIKKHTCMQFLMLLSKHEQRHDFNNPYSSYLS